MHRKNQCIRKRLNKKSSNISLLSLLHIPSEFFCLVTATTSLFTDTKILMLKLFFVFFDTPERSQQHDTTYIKIKSEFQIKRIPFSSECNFLFTSQSYEKECCLLISSTFSCSSLTFFANGTCYSFY